MNQEQTAMLNSDIPELIEHALHAYDTTETDRIKTGFANATRRPMTLRANTLKATKEEVASSLDAAGITYERVTWYPDAFILDGSVTERMVWDLELYKTGAIYLQSLSSMMPPLALAPRAGQDILDMCAAPGGKTSQMVALASGNAHITACEMNAPRAEKLDYNLTKLGAHNVNIMRVDARKLDEFFRFDQILLDAPCTGTGTYRSGDTRATKRMTQKLLAKTTRSQRALLDRALTILKPGGTLLYSTCSILPEENSEQVAAALKKHRDCELIPLTMERARPAADDIEPLPPTAQALIDALESGEIPQLESGLTGTVTICPSTQFEGFYLAALTKRA